MKLIKKLATATTIVALGVAVPAWAAEDTDNNNSSHDSSITHKGTETTDQERERAADEANQSTKTYRHHHRRDTTVSSYQTDKSDSRDRKVASYKTDRSDRNDKSARSASKEEKAELKFSKASEIIGMKVRNPQNEDLGTIKDLVVDLHSGNAKYAILSSGGILGMGNKLIAVPSKEFAFNKQDSTLVLNVDKDRLTNAPQFDENAFASGRDWDRSIDNYYSRKVSSTSRSVSSNVRNADKDLPATGKEKVERRSTSESQWNSSTEKSDSQNSK